MHGETVKFAEDILQIKLINVDFRTFVKMVTTLKFFNIDEFLWL